MMKVTMTTLAKMSDAMPRAEFLAAEHALVKAAFELVADPTDWRGPVCKDFAHAALAECVFDVDLIKYAASYFTATDCSVEYHHSAGVTRFRAKGYRAGPAGP